jgi:hypothetical protein
MLIRLFKGLYVPKTIDSVAAQEITSDHAYEMNEILRAEVYIAERRYRISLVAARTHHLHLLQTRRRYSIAMHERRHLLRANIIRPDSISESLEEDSSPCTTPDDGMLSRLSWSVGKDSY